MQNKLIRRLALLALCGLLVFVGYQAASSRPAVCGALNADCQLVENDQAKGADAQTTAQVKTETARDQQEDQEDRDEIMTTKQEENVNIANFGNQEKAEIYLAAGCFWGTEAYFKLVPGVLDTEVGYANGASNQTNYQEVAQTGHAETLKITYDAHKLHLAELLERYYRIIDPYSVNRQGNDIGTQYRTGIYFTDEESGALAKRSLANFEDLHGKKTAIELEKLDNFVKAEDYHQDYLDKNPGGYCHINVQTAADPLFPGKELFSDAELQKTLDPTAFKVARQQGTEAPFTSPLDQEFGPGIYVDKATGQPLFSSDDKFDGGCGWPSFTMPITTDVVNYYQDTSYGMNRTEVRAKNTNHLGHVFEDGPKEAGALRYCINGAILRFVPLEDMEAEGYGALIPFVEVEK